MRRLRILLFVVALAIGVPVALLAWRALDGLAMERAVRQQAVAERAFDEMERQLTGFLEVEERRPFEGVTSDVSAWFIGSERDVDLEGFHGDDPIGLMRAIFPRLQDVQMIPGAGHMMPLEAAAELNVILLDYLSRILGESL